MSIAGTGKFGSILGTATQLGFVVKDLDKAVDHWVNVLGVGPFLFLENGVSQPVNPAHYMGEEVRIEMRLAFAYMGDVQLELIEQVNDAPSPYRDFIAGGREGLQHLGYYAEDHDLACRTLEANGYSRALEVDVPGQLHPIIYYQAPDLVGPMVEIVPARWRRARQAIAKRLAAWDGGDPLVRYDTYSAFLTAENVIFD